MAEITLGMTWGTTPTIRQPVLHADLPAGGITDRFTGVFLAKPGMDMTVADDAEGVISHPIVVEDDGSDTNHDAVLTVTLIRGDTTGLARTAETTFVCSFTLTDALTGERYVYPVGGDRLLLRVSGSVGGIG